MPTNCKRGRSAAICIGHFLIVAGGFGEQSQDLTTVEVMDTNTLQWFIAASLPKGICGASMTACDDDLYLLGDYSTNVYSCSLQALLQSCQTPEKASASQQISVWNRITDLPVSSSTAITLCGQLVCIGGEKDKKQLTVYTVTTQQQLHGRLLDRFHQVSLLFRLPLYHRETK